MKDERQLWPTLIAILIALPSQSCESKGESGILVEPASHIEHESSRRGDREQLSYKITNRTTVPLLLEVVGKSCDCISATIERGQLNAGEGTQVYVQARVPLAGTEHGTVTIKATEETASRLEEKFMLSYAVTAKRSKGLEVAPINLPIDENGRTMLPSTISLSCYDAGTPIDAVLIAEPMGIQLAFKWVLRWARDDRGGFTTIIELNQNVISGADLGVVEKIQCFVPTEEGGTMEVIIEPAR